MSKNKKLMVCTPVHSSVSVFYTKACLDLQKKFISDGIEIEFQQIRSSLVTEGRNLCVAAFLNSDYSHMLFVDSDIEFSVKSVIRLFNSNYEIALIPYPKKLVSDEKFKKDIIARPNHNIRTLGLQYSISIVNPKDINPKDGFIQISKGPAGMMMIQRSAFQKLIDKKPELKIDQETLINGNLVKINNYFNFFNIKWSPEQNNYFGEDVYFCDLWTSIGGEIFALVDEYITHVGDYKYTGRLIDEFSKKS